MPSDTKEVAATASPSACADAEVNFAAAFSFWNEDCGSEF